MTSIKDESLGGAAEESAVATGGADLIPEDVLIILPVRNTVVFPGAVIPLTIGRKISIAAAEEASRSGRKIGLVMQRDPTIDEPKAADLYPVGTIARIVRYFTSRDGTQHVVCQGERRFRTLDYIDGMPFLAARFDLMTEHAPENTELEARFRILKDHAIEAIGLLPQAMPELAGVVNGIESPGQLADLVAGFLDIKPAEKQRILETLELRTRLDKVLEHLNHQIEVLKLSRKLEEQTKEKIDERQREFYLREQMKAIRTELGEGEEGGELEDLRKAVAEAKMPEEAAQQAAKELKRLERMPEESTEHSMVRTYLDWLIALPWAKLDAEAIDISRAREILDEDHFGLPKVKQRILEYLAVRKLNPEGRSPILCFVGPPGVGKTSLGQSIARALGLKFVRASLGGVHDEAEIRGHRRTYIGSLPGNVIQQIRKAGTRNPVFMLDEMDKLGISFHGDPSSALLEVLDPEQNGTFRDNYVGVPFDLSKVFFLGTANVLDTIPGPLRDRMEIIELPGYTQEEKLEIARRYLVKRQLKANGLTEEQTRIDDDALREIIASYTREAGVRNLEREIGSVLRNVAVRITEGKAPAVSVTRESVAEILGAPKFEFEVALRTATVGCGDGTGLDAGRRRHSVRRGYRCGWQGRIDPHGPAWGRHEGKRAGRSHPREGAGEITRTRGLPLRRARFAHSRARRGHSKRRPERGRCAVHFGLLAADQSQGAQRRRDDRRDQPARAGAAGRRDQGKGAGCVACGDPHRAAPGPQSQGSRGNPGKRARRARIRLAGNGGRCTRPGAGTLAVAGKGSAAASLPPQATVERGPKIMLVGCPSTRRDGSHNGTAGPRWWARERPRASSDIPSGPPGAR